MGTWCRRRLVFQTGETDINIFCTVSIQCQFFAKGQFNVNFQRATAALLSYIFNNSLTFKANQQLPEYVYQMQGQPSYKMKKKRSQIDCMWNPGRPKSF